MLYATVWTWGDICVAWDGVSRVYDVWVMSTRHGCQAIARRQVCVTRRDYRHVQRALGEVEWRRWVVRSCAGGLREVIGRWRYIAARGKYRYTSGAFLGVLMRDWSYVSVREVICDMSEVFVCLPFKEGPVSNRCSMSFWGSECRSQQMVYRSIYSEIQDDSKQKSVVGVCLMIWNSSTWKNSSWDDVCSWVWNLLIEANLFLPIGGTVLRKTWIKPNILRQEGASVLKLPEMVHCSSRSIF